MKQLSTLCILIILTILTGCSTPSMPTGSLVTPNMQTEEQLAEQDDTFLPVVMRDTALAGMTYHQPDGNRIVEGEGQLPNTEPIDIALLGQPTWVVATATMTRTVWAVALMDGSIQAFEVANGAVTAVEVTPNQLPIGSPPVLTLSRGIPRLLLPGADASVSTHAVLLNDRGGIAYIEIDGDLVIQQAEQVTTLAVDALPDARILVDESARLLLLSGPTERYGHGVLGDRIEASRITLIETNPTPQIVQTIEIAAPDVIEGIAPIWADLNNDGQREIIVTHSNASVGAWVAVYAESGELLASGPNIGRGSRWRHQLAVAPFGPNGELELVDVLTPHIGGIVEFYQWQDDQLSIVAQQSGYTSHVIGTRNLDLAVAADFDSDNRIELLLPTQSRTALGAIRHQDDGAAVAWLLPVDGTITTNLAAVSTEGGQIAVGVGRADSVLRIWP